MSQLFGPALEAELAYRRERAAQAYHAPTWWDRWRTRRATRGPAARPVRVRAGAHHHQPA
ncbi:hypothetical protein [Isoptericola sp. b408]|uniref:hypothetical protein n=1 Tax=Isoptericola sp. b408 TaxID=3064653 RepID=UPI0027129050|nr:hypothetical protein [Isoptericola sp. b408]MDO8149897.1 hypothetical protein [Isoptericola sp. b408]